MNSLPRLSLLSALALTLLLPTAAAATLIRPSAALAPALTDPIRKLDQELTTKHPQTVALDTPRRAKNAPLPTPELRAYLVHNKTDWYVVVVNRTGKGSTEIYPYAYCKNNPLRYTDPTGMWYTDKLGGKRAITVTEQVLSNTGNVVIGAVTAVGQDARGLARAAVTHHPVVAPFTAYNQISSIMSDPRDIGTQASDAASGVGRTFLGSMDRLNDPDPAVRWRERGAWFPRVAGLLWGAGEALGVRASLRAAATTAADIEAESAIASEGAIEAAATISPKIARQMGPRGWTSGEITDVVSRPAAIRRAINRATGNRATAYFREDGSYVVVDDITEDVVQISNRNDPNWRPDPSIEDPFRP